MSPARMVPSTFPNPPMMTIAKAFTITATDVSLTGPAALVVQVASSTSYDRIVATGGVTLNNATLTVVDEGYLPDLDNPVLTLISGAGAATGSFNGRVRLMFKEGNTTSIPHVLFVVRTIVIRAGTPARRLILSGS